MRKKATDKLRRKRNTVKEHDRVAAPKKPALTETGDSFEARVDDSIHLQERKAGKTAKRKSTASKLVRGLLVLL